MSKMNERICLFRKVLARASVDNFEVETVKTKVRYLAMNR